MVNCPALPCPFVARSFPVALVTPPALDGWPGAGLGVLLGSTTKTSMVGETMDSPEM